jgi:hypothetical protein
VGANAIGVSPPTGTSVPSPGPPPGGSLVGSPPGGESVGGLEGVGVRLGHVCWKCNGRALLALDHKRIVEIKRKKIMAKKAIDLVGGILFMIFIQGCRK